MQWQGTAPSQGTSLLYEQIWGSVRVPPFGSQWVEEPELSPPSWGCTAPLSHQTLSLGTQPGGHPSAKAPAALGCQQCHPALGKGHLLPPGIAAISCSCQPGAVSLPSLPRPAAGKGAGDTQGWEFEELSRALPCELFVQTICLPRAPSWALWGAWWSCKDSAVGDILQYPSP